MVTRVLGYVRVSHNSQVESGLSLSAQREKLAAYCLATDLNLVGIIEDAGRSAKSLDRPGLQEALEALREGRVDAILVLKLDRLTRSVRDLGDLLEGPFANGGLIAVQDSVDTRSAAGKLVLNVLTSVAQWERQATGERTKAALEVVKAQGGTLGTPRYGYSRTRERDDFGRLKVSANPSELATLARAKELRALGYTLEDTAWHLQQEGFKTRRGGKWRVRTVRLILQQG